MELNIDIVAIGNALSELFEEAADEVASLIKAMEIAECEAQEKLERRSEYYSNIAYLNPEECLTNCRDIRLLSDPFMKSTKWLPP